MPSLLRPDLSLPPAFSLISLREAGDAFAHAKGIAAHEGAGAIVWTRRFDLAEFALVLEPEEPLHEARRVLYAGANALADVLSALAPPERPITMDWPDALRVDGVLVGGVRLGWPDETTEDSTPDWLVLGAMVRTVVMRAGEPGLRPLLGGLDEEGFEELSPSEIIESFARYFLREMHEWDEAGFSGVCERWTGRSVADRTSELSDDAALRAALATPSWLDPKTGTPWL